MILDNYAVDKDSYYFAWTGGIPLLVSGLHSFQLEQLDGKIILKNCETFWGPLVPLMRWMGTLDDCHKVFDKANQDFKAYVEKGGRASK